MKIGTDSLLLGAWASIDNSPNSILDIGTGCGILALQMAQSSRANTIDAIEPDADSYEQAVGNFENSPWADRLFCYHCTLQEFLQEPEELYDVVISNPPFYDSAFTSPNLKRANARHTGSLSFESLVEAMDVLLSKNGIFNLILPYPEEEKFIAIAASQNIFPHKICRVKDRTDSPTKRSLLALGFEEKIPIISQLELKNDTGGYCNDFKNLTGEFYMEL